MFMIEGDVKLSVSRHLDNGRKENSQNYRYCDFCNVYVKQLITRLDIVVNPSNKIRFATW